MENAISRLIVDTARSMLASERAAHPVLVCKAGMTVARLMALGGCHEDQAHRAAAMIMAEIHHLYEAMRQLRAQAGGEDTTSDRGGDRGGHGGPAVPGPSDAAPKP